MGGNGLWVFVWVGRWICRFLDGWIDGWMDGWMDGMKEERWMKVSFYFLHSIFTDAFRLASAF